MEKVYKELERLIVINKIRMSVDKVLDTAKTITTIRVRMPENGTYFTKPQKSPEPLPFGTFVCLYSIGLIIISIKSISSLSNPYFSYSCASISPMLLLQSMSLFDVKSWRGTNEYTPFAAF